MQFTSFTIINLYKFWPEKAFKKLLEQTYNIIINCTLTFGDKPKPRLSKAEKIKIFHKKIADMILKILFPSKFKLLPSASFLVLNACDTIVSGLVCTSVDTLVNKSES